MGSSAPRGLQSTPFFCTREGLGLSPVVNLGSSRYPLSSCEGLPLLNGKQFRLERGTLAVEGVNSPDSKPRAVTVPAGAIIKVISGPQDGDGLVSVLWEGRTLGMFEVDVNVRGTEITDESATA